MNRDKFEYKEHSNLLKYEDRLEMLNRYGQEGWELVLIRGGNNYVFKRKILYTGDSLN